MSEQGIAGSASSQGFPRTLHAERPRMWRGLEAVIHAARQRQRRRRITLAVVLIVAASISTYFAVGRAGTSPSTNARTGLTVRRFPLHGGPVALASADGSLWVVLETNGVRASLIRLDPANGHRLASYLIGRSGPDFGAATSVGNAVYATAGEHVIRIDPHSNSIERARIPGEGSAITVGDGSVWIASIGSRQARDMITRLNTQSLAPQHKIALSFQPVAVQAGLGSVWLASTSGMWRIAPATNALRPTSIAWQNPVATAVSDERLWVIQQSTLLVGVDHLGRIRRRIELPFYPGAIAVSGTNVWVTNNCGCTKGLVARVDSRTGRVTSERQIGETPVAVTTDATGAWVATFADGTLTHLIQRH